MEMQIVYKIFLYQLKSTFRYFRTKFQYIFTIQSILYYFLIEQYIFYYFSPIDLKLGV